MFAARIPGGVTEILLLDFALPPNYPSQSRRFFQVWSPSGLPRRADHSVYFGSAQCYCANPFSLTRVLSRALGFSPHPPESVYSTITKGALHAAFLGSMGLPSVLV